MNTSRFYGRRATLTRARVVNHDGVVHIVTETGAEVACGLRIASEPWKKEKGQINGAYLSSNTVATCMPCLAYELPPRAKP